MGFFSYGDVKTASIRGDVNFIVSMLGPFIGVDSNGDFGYAMARDFVYVQLGVSYSPACGNVSKVGSGRCRGGASRGVRG